MNLRYYLFIILDACFLPKIEGPCEGYYPHWYYDSERKQCGQFIYGGCLGNNNRFETREECQDLCVIPDTLGKFPYGISISCGGTITTFGSLSVAIPT
jgi:hypothetical protein